MVSYVISFVLSTHCSLSLWYMCISFFERIQIFRLIVAACLFSTFAHGIIFKFICIWSYFFHLYLIVFNFICISDGMVSNFIWIWIELHLYLIVFNFICISDGIVCNFICIWAHTAPWAYDLFSSFLIFISFWFERNLRRHFLVAACFGWSTATNSSTLQHTWTHCHTLQHTVICCNTLHTATHCHTLHHTASYSNTLHHTAIHCNTLHRTATHCTIVQHTLGG